MQADFYFLVHRFKIEPLDFITQAAQLLTRESHKEYIGFLLAGPPPDYIVAVVGAVRYDHN